MGNEELLKKWLNDELNADERKAFEQFEDFELNQKVIEGAQKFKASHFSKVRSFSEFKDHLNKNQIKETPVITMNRYKFLYRIAALFVIGLGLYFAFFNNQLSTVKTLASQQRTFELPDASTVTLNTASQVVYNKRSWNKKRELQLEGEAFFKVAKGSKFDVKTSEGIVSVLGTQFTVKQRKGYFEVKCFEGIVGVTHKDTTVKLTKGNTYRFLNGLGTMGKIDKISPDWLHNITNFESVPLSEVLSEIERQYAVKIVTENIDVNRIFTGGFVHNNLEEALNAVTIPLDLSYKKEQKNTIIISPKK